MNLFQKMRLLNIRRLIGVVVCMAICLATATPAHAEWGKIDSFNVAPVVPIVLDAFMAVATGGYEFFVQHQDGSQGIIYLLVWGFLFVSIALYLVKMYFPKNWVAFFGFTGGGEMWSGTDATTIATNVLKPCIRAIVAAALLLQIKPVYVTEWLVNPFLQFGAIYTHSITETINANSTAPEKAQCPQDILDKAWISKDSCEFMIQPVYDISNANNQVVKRGFQFITSGLRGLITPIPHGGADFMNIVSGILLVTTFVSCNLFMALLIIQAIFEFGMSLILYPFQVLTWVVKPSDKWLDLWPAFSGIIQALQKLIITMIACAFILCVNIAVIRALFQWNNSMFVVAAGGSASSNVPQIAHSAGGFGQHCILWLSAILTFYLMLRIFELTRKQLESYVGSGQSALYNDVTRDSKKVWAGVADWGKKIGRAVGWLRTT